jgi:hypothetical protein
LVGPQREEALANLNEHWPVQIAAAGAVLILGFLATADPEERVTNQMVPVGTWSDGTLAH